jgi:formate--tetrahydrofolate ligase
MLRPISQVAEELGISAEHLLPYGRGKAKIDIAALDRPRAGKGNLILVSAINPTPAGEGKTTVSIGLAMALRRMGRRTALALREPSLGPVFGMKGGATGGGRTQIAPAADINLHFTGDMHAITSAHNLLAAMVDNDLHYGARSGIDPRYVTWGRALDMNDRALRDVIVGLGGPAGGVPRQTRFDITAASEVMAILCLATGRTDLRARLARIVVGRGAGGKLITADAVGAADAMAALLNDAIDPNLVQTLDGGPVLVHGGPFGNIAHGCSSLLATRVAIHQADDVITEAGFGFDLGAEKFLHIKCRAGEIWPRCVVLVATVRALKVHGGVAVADAAQPNSMALDAGLAHLDQHLLAADAFGLTPVVAINVFAGDVETELARVEAHCKAHGVAAARSTGYSHGGEGATDLARAVAAVVDDDKAPPPAPRSLYRLEDSYEDKLRAIARTVYGADDVIISPAAATSFARIEDSGHGGLPVCVAKTHLSLSDDPRLTGAPRGFVVTAREARLSAGAGFVVALLGDVLTMPGLPREPAALKVRVDADGKIRGLMQHE